MGKKAPKLTGIKRLTTREYGGNGYQTPTTQDTGKGFGRGSQKPHKPIRRAGKGI